MLKSELVAKLATRMGVDHRSAERTLNHVLGSICDALWETDRVRIPGFGTFRARLNFEGKRRVDFNSDKPLRERDDA